MEPETAGIAAWLSREIQLGKELLGFSESAKYTVDGEDSKCAEMHLEGSLSEVYTRLEGSLQGLEVLLQEDLQIGRTN